MPNHYLKLEVLKLHFVPRLFVACSVLNSQFKVDMISSKNYDVFCHKIHETTHSRSILELRVNEIFLVQSAFGSTIFH